MHTHICIKHIYMHMYTYALQRKGRRGEETEEGRGGGLTLYREWVKCAAKAIHLTDPFCLAVVSFTSFLTKFKHPKCLVLFSQIYCGVSLAIWKAKCKLIFLP